MINILQYIFLANLAHPPSIIVTLSSHCFNTSHDTTKNRSILGRKRRKKQVRKSRIYIIQTTLNPLCGVFEFSKPMILEIANIVFYPIFWP